MSLFLVIEDGRSYWTSKPTTPVCRQAGLSGRTLLHREFFLLIYHELLVVLITREWLFARESGSMTTDDDILISLMTLTEIFAPRDEESTIGSSTLLFRFCFASEGDRVVEGLHSDEDVECDDIFELDITKCRIEEFFRLIARSKFASCFERPEDGVDAVDGFFDGCYFFICLDDRIHRWYSTESDTEHIVVKHFL